MKIRGVMLSLVLIVAAWPAAAKFMMPSAVPVERLLANTEAFLKTHPEDPQAWYTLARIHYLAFANQATSVAAFEKPEAPDGLPRVAADWGQGNVLYLARREEAIRRALATAGYAGMRDVPEVQRAAVMQAAAVQQAQLDQEGWYPETLSVEALIAHARAADAAFEKALARDAHNALFVLGQASLWRQVTEWAAKAKVEAPVAAATPAAIREQFLKAHRLAIQRDLQMKNKPLHGLGSLIGYEAGKAYLQLTAGDSDTPALRERRAAVKQSLAKLEALPRGPITPIIFSLADRVPRLTELLAPDRTVLFDLDGDGVAERWPWLQADAALLVWDPERTGDIRSGRQLFGSVSWWLFFPDGYRALDALDDNRDGELAGAELAGIRCWCDRNGNGVSEPGEIMDLAACGIVAVRVAADGVEGATLRAAQGLRLADGRYRPTWDWAPLPVARHATLADR